MVYQFATYTIDLIDNDLIYHSDKACIQKLGDHLSSIAHIYFTDLQLQH